MPTKDFVIDFGAPTDGTTLCTAALAAWNTFAQNPANAPATLTINGAGVTNNTFNTTGLNMADHLANATITCSNGAKLTDCIVGAFNVFPQDNTFPSYALIQTVCAGSTTVTLKTAGDASKYIVGQWVVIGGLETQKAGAPVNLQRFEFCKITNIAGGILTLSAPLVNSYASTWPTIPNSNDGPAAVYGIAGTGGNPTATQMISVMEGTLTINNLILSAGAFATSMSGFIVLNNADLSNATGDALTGDGFSPSQARSVILNNCTLPYVNVPSEIDKIVDYLELNNCGNVNCTISIQSGSVNKLVIKNGSIIGNAGAVKGLGGTVHEVVIDSSTVGALYVNPLFHGRSNKLTITNSTIGSWSFATGNQWKAMGVAFANLGSGLFRISKTDAWLTGSDDSFVSRLAPGFSMAMGFMTGGWSANGNSVTITPDSGGVVSFCILNVYEDASFFYIQTDLPTTLPTPLFGGLASNVTWAYPFKSYTGPSTGLPATGVNALNMLVAPSSCTASTDCTVTPSPPPPPPPSGGGDGHHKYDLGRYLTYLMRRRLANLDRLKRKRS